MTFSFGIFIGFVLASLYYFVVLIVQLRIDLNFIDRRIERNKRSLIRIDKEIRKNQIELDLLKKIQGGE